MTSNEMGAPNVTRQGNSIAPTKEAVESAINKSKTLVEALESVAAMYQIPAENIVVDDRVNGIRVTGDCIVTPDKPNPSANTKAIVCAIGAVLDNISQRIDSKLNTYQNAQIQQNRIIANQKQPDPSKGEVVGRFFDSRGGEIIAYSSGLVDSDCTPESQAKVRELRASKQIPDFVSEPDKPAPPSNPYFSAEEDDIMNGVPTTNDNIKIDIDKQAHDISQKINESAYFINLVDMYGGTTTLGYDMLHEHFDYVKPTAGMIQEADQASSAPSAKDLKHMRFDNTELMKAVELFNAARLSFMDTNPSLKDICRNDKFKEAIRCIERQFDCHLAMRFFEFKDEDGKEITDGYVSTFNDIHQPISVSKSKGFQLHGTPVDIDLGGKILQINPASKDRELFGQTVLGIILHEIWHQISCSLEKENGQFVFTVSSAMAMATATDNMHNRRVIMSNCVNALAESSGRKMNALTKRVIVKKLMTLASTKYEEQRVQALKAEAADSTDLAALDKYIAAMEKYIDKHDPERKADKTKKKKHPGLARKIVGTSIFVVGTLLAITKILAPVGLMMMIGGMGVGVVGGTDKAVGEAYAEEIKKWLATTDKEEYYADLFAAMYGLPNVWSVGPASKYITANQVDKDRLQKIINLEREMGKLMFDPHPSPEERSYAAMTAAKKMLGSGEKLDPAIKKYCEWIVANYSSLEDTNLKEVFASNIFDPKEAEDLDAHLQNIVDHNNIQVTESVQ
jgi:hypothetical protein